MKPLVRSSNTKHQQNAVAIAIACSILLVLSGCGIPKLRQPQPDPTCRKLRLPPVFNGATSSENSSQIPTAEFFNDPTLTTLIDQALFGNQQLRILAQDIADRQQRDHEAARDVPSLCHFWGRRVAG